MCVNNLHISKCRTQTANRGWGPAIPLPTRVDDVAQRDVDDETPTIVMNLPRTVDS